MNKEPAPPSRPRATYRLQLGSEFRFEDARRIVPYLSRLGVSHLYASPFMMARPGSTHGYDVVDPRRLNPELGGEDELGALVEELHRHGMGLILDFVPNHMGIGAHNPWWREMLEWGKGSPCAKYFDVDWDPPEPTLRGKVLLPVLGDHYGAVLERGELEVRMDESKGSFAVHYFEARFPISPRHTPILLRRARMRGGTGAAPLESHIGEWERLLEGMPEGTAPAPPPARALEALRHRLVDIVRGHRTAREAIRSALVELNGRPGDPESFDALHRLLDRQMYRLSFWRVAASEINYRRFFDIDELAGLRMELPALFDASHGLIRKLLDRGWVQGLRLDHVDGLRDPKEYFRRLRTLRPPYLIVEKILAPHERLPADWEVDGTTGYEFMADANGLFVDPAGERGLSVAYARFIEGSPEFASTLESAKRLIMREALASELNLLATAFHRITRSNRNTRDYTLSGFRTALADVVAHLAVYRTYLTEAGASETDRAELERAVGRARRRTRQPDSSIYDLILDVLTLDLLAGDRGAFEGEDVVDAALRFQQYSGPVMAKAMEDTAFYRFHRLVSLNEVGGAPDHFGTSPEAFHRNNRERSRTHPFSMVATATHDHKRGEDSRARINVLSEIPREWARRSRRWARMNRRWKATVEGRPAPEPNDEYLFYQTLVGAWPFDLAPPHFAAMPAFRARMDEYMVKALREAKARTSWVAPDQEYEGATRTFVEKVLEPADNGAFVGEIEDFVRTLAPAGAINGLSQTLVKLASPGVPDLYQGTELWDFSLVDPDNRRPVDYGKRSAGLRAKRPPRELLRRWEDGSIKQDLIARVLAFRRRHPHLFAEGGYEALPVRGLQSDRILSFARVADGEIFAVLAPRLAFPLLQGSEVPFPVGWGDTVVHLPGAWAGSRLLDLLTGRTLDVAADGALQVEEVLCQLPIAALTVPD